ncbi:TIGR00730 family Rossman fold protein [Beijerinckia sp. L45]|uniref:LOG family protein n=1 Tax=Beijerinckia sp. L45 TaxID=1641855 RepID=UPI00131E0F78|nr:TIGR00730 family Rossman fold protein [Beijerinckia sp. L45]
MFDSDTGVQSLEKPQATPFKNICVYCGSAGGTDPLFLAAAKAFGAQMAAEGIGLVYGGGGRGMMGATARAVIEAGGHVTGIIPDFLTDNDAMLVEAQELNVVPDMHTRKRLMFEQSDAFVALPGGIGTLEELVEQLTWLQLERHTKPVLIADIGGFWRPLLALFEHMREMGFIPPTLEVRYLVAETWEDILPMLTAAAERNAALGLKKETVDSRL